MSSRTLSDAPELLTLHTGVFDFGTRQLRGNAGVVLTLTTRESLLLSSLVAARGAVVPTEALLQQVWGRRWTGEPTELGVVRNSVFKLRQKLERNVAMPDHVLTVQGEGYRFVPLTRSEEGPAGGSLVLLPSSGLPPAGDLWSASWDLGMASERRVATEALAQPHRPLLLLAPWRAGKSWLLRGLLAQLRPEDVVLRIDPRATPIESLNDTTELVLLLALLLADAAGLPEDLAEQVATGRGPPAWRLKRWMERHILPVLPGRMVLVVEDLDRLARKPVFGDTVALLRSWSEEERPGWEHLRLICTSAVALARLSVMGASSPFNLGVTVTLGDLNPETIEELMQRARAPISLAQARRLHELAGGQPYLVRLLCTAALEQGLDRALSPEGLDRALEPALFELDARLAAAPELRQSLDMALRAPNEALPDTRLEPLLRLGLLRGERRPYAPRSAALVQRLLR